MPLFNLSALTRHTDYSSAFVLYVAIRKSHVYYAYRVLTWLESVFHILQGTPARQPRAQLLHGRCTANTRGKSQQSARLAAHSQPCPTAPSLSWSLEQVEGLWKDHDLFLPNCTRLMRPAEESLLETGQHEPCRASHLEPRGVCLPHLHLLPTPSYGAGSVILLCKELEQGLWKRNKGERRFENEV